MERSRSERQQANQFSIFDCRGCDEHRIVSTDKNFVPAFPEKAIHAAVIILDEVRGHF